MKLNLNKFVTKDDEIEWKDEVLLINTSIPRAITKKYFKQEKNYEIEQEQIVEFVKDILYIKNDKEKVDRIVNEWDDIMVAKVFVFYSKCVENKLKDVKTIKKKMNTKTEST